SGDPSPSRADIDITQTIIAAAKPLGISVHDHIIVGASGQVSLRSKGLFDAPLPGSVTSLDRASPDRAEVSHPPDLPRLSSAANGPP
ncbi:hypothetical protein NYZ69_19365, partial [Acinetobacter baumannii]|nr:hypothetical protein [Acinetobacter baumannii]